MITAVDTNILLDILSGSMSWVIFLWVPMRLSTRTAHFRGILAFTRPTSKTSRCSAPRDWKPLVPSNLSLRPGGSCLIGDPLLWSRL